MAGSMSKRSYTFFILSCVALWMFFSPKLGYLPGYHKNSDSSLLRTPLVATSAQSDSLHDPRAFSSLPQRRNFSGDAEGVHVGQNFLETPTLEVEKNGNISEQLPSFDGLNTDLQQGLTTVAPEELLPRQKYIIKWKDRNMTNIDVLPLLDGEQQPTSSPGKATNRVIYNRVGKCGSRSVLTLLDSLAKRNQFYLISSQTFNDRRIGPKYQAKLVSTLSRINGPFMYQRHLHFVNFTEFGGVPPTYINIIRDPMERAISQYYFIRFGDEKKQERKFTLNSTDPIKYMSYEECVLRKLPECVGKKSFYIIPFFCGHDDRCKFPSMWSYMRAVANVKEHFPAVGILEELEGSIQVFEKILPDMFDGAVGLLKKYEQNQQTGKASVGVTKYKQKPSEKTASYMKTVVMKYEYLFYSWIRHRLHIQMQKFGIASSNSPPESR